MYRATPIRIAYVPHLFGHYPWCSPVTAFRQSSPFSNDVCLLRFYDPDGEIYAICHSVASISFPVCIARHLRLLQDALMVYDFEIWFISRFKELSSSPSWLCHHVHVCGLLQRPSCALLFLLFSNPLLVTVVMWLPADLPYYSLLVCTSNWQVLFFSLHVCFPVNPCLWFVFFSPFQQEPVFSNSNILRSNHFCHHRRCHGRFFYCFHPVLRSISYLVIPTATCSDITSPTFSSLFCSFVVVHLFSTPCSSFSSSYGCIPRSFSFFILALCLLPFFHDPSFHWLSEEQNS